MEYKNLKFLLLAFSIVIGTAFFFGYSCKAVSFTEGFDSYGNAYQINNISEFASSTSYVVTTNADNFSGGYSVKLDTNSYNLKRNFDTYYPQEISFYGKYKQTIYQGINCTFSFATSSYFYVGMNYSSNNKISWGIYDNEFGFVDYDNDAKTVTQNTWILNHITYTNNLFNYYIDGELIKSFDTHGDFIYSINCYGVGSSETNDNFIDNWYDDSSYVYSSGTVSVIDIDEWQGTIEVSSEGIIVDSEKICIINAGACTIGVRYSYSDVGKTAYVFNDYDFDENDIDLSDAYDTEELTASGTLKKNLDTPPAYYPIQKDFITLVLNNNEIDSIWKTKISYIEDEADTFFSEWDCATICDGISTSTDFFSGVANGFECAGKKLACWMLKPSSSSLTSFASAKLSLESSFPFSVYNQIKNEFADTNIASTTALTLDFRWETFGLPNPQDKTIVLASSTVMTTTFGSLWTQVYGISEKIIYFFAFIYFVMRIIKIAKKEPDVQTI